MDCRRILFSSHALQRLFERQLTRDAVVSAIREGSVIAAGPRDNPYPTAIVLGYPEESPLHVVVARDPETATCVVVTAYRPDPTLWSDDFRTRRR